MKAPIPPRYSRHVALPQFGPAGQQRLGRSTAFLMGLGGLGSVAGLYLANAGIGRLVLNDFDRVDVTNLPRQILFRDSDVGRAKTAATAARLRESNPAPELVTIDRRLDEAGLVDALRGCDVALDCTDNFATRVLLNRACVATKRPLVSGAAIRFEGQVAVFATRGADSPCYQCLYSDDDEHIGDCAGQGVLAPVAGVVGAMVAIEALKLLLGIDSGLRDHLWVHDALSGASRRIRIRRSSACPTCGT